MTACSATSGSGSSRAWMIAPITPCAWKNASSLQLVSFRASSAISRAAFSRTADSEERSRSTTSGGSFMRSVLHWWSARWRAGDDPVLAQPRQLLVAHAAQLAQHLVGVFAHAGGAAGGRRGGGAFGGVDME